MSERPALGDATSRLANTLPPMTVSDLHNAEADTDGIPMREPSKGTKRKAQEPPLISPEEMDNVDLTGQNIDKSCNQVRGQIRRFLESGEMTKTAFSNAIGCSSRSIDMFLAQNGPYKGAGSATYGNAWEFFKKREMAGIKTTKKKAKTSSAAASAPATDISNVSLPGEESGGVEVYDSCDEIRKKINAHLVKPGVTQAGFCRDLTAQLKTGTKIQSKQLSDFRSKKGPSMGNTSSVFYAAYVYFEKLRLAENKPKSKHRKEMEAAWAGRGGFDREHGGHLGVWTCAKFERPVEDRLGQINFERIA